MNKLTIVFMAWMCCCLEHVSSSNLELLILHNNDMHAHFEEYGSSLDGKKIGGFGRTLTIIKKARKEAEEGKGPPVLYLNAGDTFTGTVWFSVHKWKIASDFMNLLKPDAMCLGTHEFNNDCEGLVPFIRNSKFPIVSANLDFRNEPRLRDSKVLPSVILERGGVAIGIIGYLTPNTKHIALTTKTIFNDEVEVVRKESDRLHAEGVTVIIALGHSGYLMDMKIAQEVPHVDLVVGGHTNTFLWNGFPPDREKPVGPYPKVVTQKNGKVVPVLHAYAYTKYLGALNITFDEKGRIVSFQGQPIFLSENVPQDPEATILLDEYGKVLRGMNDEIIGKTKVYLGGEYCRLGECNFGNMICDAMIRYKAELYKGPHWTDTAIALINSGAIRGGVNNTKSNGTITRSDLLGVFPFGQVLVSVTLKGEDLLQSLEIGVRSNGETSRGEFLQVAGLRVVYDMANPIGSRVLNVRVRCNQCFIPIYEALDRDKEYSIITTAFLTSGGDGHDIIRTRGAKFLVENIIDYDCLVNYIIERDVVYPETEERHKIFNPKAFLLSDKGNSITGLNVIFSICISSYIAYPF